MTYNTEAMREAIVQKLRLNYGCTEKQANEAEMMKACALVLRDIMAERGVRTKAQVIRDEKRKVHYMSLEFLMGRSLVKNAFNLGAGRGARQRRSRPSRRVLSRQHDDARDPRDGVFHLL